jgi:cytochrome c553
LWWIDLRDYNWDEESFETVAVADPYIRKPWVGEHYDKLRLIAGNALIRVDWFLMHTCDTTRQVDYDREPLYYTLLYAQQKIPTSADEYRSVWGIDINRVEKFGLARGGVVDQGKSIVSRHTRELTGIRTDIGYHWESSDFKNTEHDKDVLENLSINRNKDNVPIHVGLARKADAHEYITTNLLGLQVYFLTDGNGKRIEFADSTIVVDNSDKTGDVRVRTSRSCVICHGIGINPIKSEFVPALADDVDLITKYKDYQQAVERYYFNNLSQKELDDQAIFTRAVAQCNGMDPIENAKKFQIVLDWYDKPLDVEQAAKECGVKIELFKEKISRSTSLRLLRLLEGQTIPRQIWEAPNTGLYSQAMLLLSGLELSETKEDKPADPDSTVSVKKLRMKTNAKVMDGAETITELPEGTEIEYTELNGNWFSVIIEGRKGFIHKDKVDQL